jgi:hypothetical protein
MSKLPPLKVVGQVDTSQMAAGLKSAEAKVKASQKRMAAMSAARGAATPAMGMLGGGAIGGAMGGLGALGPAGMALGLGLGAITAPFLAASKILETFRSATEGSTLALKTFQDTGVMAPGMNSTILAALSAKEKGAAEAAGGVTFEQAFVSGTAGNTQWESVGKNLDDSAKAFTAFIGALTVGKGFDQAFMEAGIVNAPEEEAKDMRKFVDNRTKQDSQAALGNMMAGDSAAVVVLKQIWRNMF